MQDAASKGRLNGRNSLKGENHGRAKLTQEDVRRLRHLYKSGVRGKALQEIFNVSYSTIWKIGTGKVRT